MRKPNLEALIESEYLQGRGIIYRRNMCYRHVLDQIIGLPPKSYLAGSELHVMINSGMNEPAYGIVSHEVFLNLKERYNATGNKDTGGWYIIEVLINLLTKLLEETSNYGLNLPG